MQANLKSRLKPWANAAVVLALLLAAAAAVLGAGAGLGTRLAWWQFPYGFAVLAWGARAGAAAAVMGLVALVIAGLAHRWVLLLLSVVALAVGLVALSIPLHERTVARMVPPIHDITTDWEQPPAFQAVLPRRAGARNPPEYGGAPVAEQQQRAYPDIRPALFREAPPAVFAAVERVARDMSWDVAAAVPAEGRLEATATTFWFGFKDDIVVRIRPIASGSRVDVRSESRVGGSDIGTNARRIRAFLKRLRTAGLTPQP